MVFANVTITNKLVFSTDGIVPPNQWTRIAFTILDQGDGNSRLAKFVDGTLVGEQTVESQRYFIDPANGLLLFNDNDFETFNGRVAAFALVFSALSDATIADLGGADLGAFFQDGSEGIVQFDFQRAPFRNGQMLATLGEGILTDRLFSEVYAEDAGIPFTNQDEDGGFRLDADYGSGITSFTLVYDLILDAVQPRGFGGLIQLDGVNLSDGDLFFRDDGDGTFGIGISGGKLVWHEHLYDVPVVPIRPNGQQCPRLRRPCLPGPVDSHRVHLSGLKRWKQSSGQICKWCLSG
jgi:hypothetical protein